jgi:hypothetical protein
MDQDLEELGELASEDWELVDRGKVRRILGMEIPPIGLDSEASFQRLMRALHDRNDRQRRRRLLLACSVGAATVIIGAMAMLRLLHR